MTITITIITTIPIPRYAQHLFEWDQARYHGFEPGCVHEFDSGLWKNLTFMLGSESLLYWFFPIKPSQLKGKGMEMGMGMDIEYADKYRLSYDAVSLQKMLLLRKNVDDVIEENLRKAGLVFSPSASLPAA